MELHDRHMREVSQMLEIDQKIVRAEAEVEAKPNGERLACDLCKLGGTEESKQTLCSKGQKTKHDQCLQLWREELAKEERNRGNFLGWNKLMMDDLHPHRDGSPLPEAEMMKD